ncbi:TIR domain-containing protein [Mesorhizobium sp. M0293]|uniref:KGGVGR-motif variant AAA ATPase n=1 Tax=unclassified Mesorhizobium TaxID=325217 RepID=UPI003339E7A7
MAGSVVTFYSYKGGVGRSFALANVGVLLSRWGFRVLCIDFDLEAPGLSHFFGSVAQDDQTRDWLGEGPGLVELVARYRRHPGAPLAWRDHVHRLSSPSLGGISLMKAGQADRTYSQRLRRLNWKSLYRSGLGGALERMFGELRDEFDYVLIDARTGVTDFSGIIAAQLPDVLAFLFTANEQSLEGSIEVARRAAKARNGLALDRSRLLLLPIPARFETQFEHRISMAWRDRFATELAEFYRGWAGPTDSTARLIQATTIPYVPYWTFGERLSVVEDETADPLGINYSLETLAALFAHRLGQTSLMLESRDDYVAAARRIAAGSRRSRSDVFLSYDHVNTFAAEEMREALSKRGLSVFMDRYELQAGEPSEAALRSAIEASDHMLVLVGDGTRERRWQEFEIRAFQRQAATDGHSRFIVPVLLDGTPTSAIPDLLRHMQYVAVSLDFDSAARKIVKMLRPAQLEPGPRPGRKCYISFDAVHDMWRVQQIRNMGRIETQPILDREAWDKVLRRGDKAITAWVDDNMRGKECLIVLVGAQTADRKWVRYEIERAWRNGLGILAIDVHNLKDRDGRSSEKGASPFDALLIEGTAMDAQTYDPPFTDSVAVYEYIRDNLRHWISHAVDARRHRS